MPGSVDCYQIMVSSGDGYGSRSMFPWFVYDFLL